jgi:hypothetical protein
MPPVVITEPHAVTHGNPMVIGIVVGVLVVLYFFYCFILKRICEKCGTEPGWLVWIPLFNTIRILQAGGLSGWWFLLFFVPIADVVIALYMWIKVCQARGKTAWLVLLLFIPVINLLFIPYLAFSE